MKLSVVSFNVRGCNDKDGNSVLERAPRLKKVISAYDADIIGFQEYTPLWEQPVKDSFLNDYEIFNKWRAEGQLESSPILWKKDKFELLKTGYFWLSDTPEVESKGWDEAYPDCCRMCVYTILKEKVSGKEFAFMNTHFGFGNHCQQGSAALINEYSAKIGDYPTLIIGDFNARADSVAYAGMTQNFTDVNAATAKNTGTTYHGYNPEKINNSHIDFCFVNSRVKPLDHKIMDETVDGMYPSDHFGIYVETEL